MELSEYLSHLEADGPALLAAASSVPTGPVPGCPAWDVTELVRHTTGVHHWVTDIISTRSPWRPKGTFFSDPPREWEPLATHYDEGLSALLAVLRTADPDVAVWNWFDDRPAPTSFWIRRMAQETVVHRRDAQAAAGVTAVIDADLAEDGIDEFLMFVAQWVRDQDPRDELVGTLDLRSTDTGSCRRVVLGPNQLDVLNGAGGEADATVEGTASDVYLWMNNRPDGRATVKIDGDATLLDAWSALAF